MSFFIPNLIPTYHKRYPILCWIAIKKIQYGFFEFGNNFFIFSFLIKFVYSKIYNSTKIRWYICWNKVTYRTSISFLSAKELSNLVIFKCFFVSSSSSSFVICFSNFITFPFPPNANKHFLFLHQVYLFVSITGTSSKISSIIDVVNLNVTVKHSASTPLMTKEV